MNKYIKKYQKIVDGLVRKSFPSLRRSKIRVFEFNITRNYGTYLGIFNIFNLHFIGLNKRYRNLPKKAIKGILVHELCHVEYFLKKNVIRNLFTGLFYLMIPSIKRKIESETDKQVIKKGYGKNMFALALAREKEFSKQELEKRYSKGYLSTKKIKYYIKKFKK